MAEDLRIAPTPVLIRCLALLRRALIVIRDYGRARARSLENVTAGLAMAQASNVRGDQARPISKSQT